MNHFPLQRVIWRDGDVITENHFYSLEKWISDFVGISNQLHGVYGFIRNPYYQEVYNKSNNIGFHHIEGSQFRIDIENLLMINQFGQVIKIDDRRSLNLNLQLFQLDDNGQILVYLIPRNLDVSNSEEVERNSEEVAKDTRVYSTLCDLSTSNETNSGVPIMRFKVQGNHIDIDEYFIPYGIFLNSHTLIIQAHDSFITEYDRLRRNIKDFMLEHRPSLESEQMVLWTLASNLHRLVEGYYSEFSDKNRSTNRFLQEFDKFIKNLDTELSIFHRGYNQDYQRQNTNDCKFVLEKKFLLSVEKQFDLAHAFQQINDVMKALMHFISKLPKGIDPEKTLPIDRVELSKVPGNNKITIFLKEAVEFKQAESLMTIYLRTFSKSEPFNRNVRVGLGSVAAAMLRDLVGALKPIQGEEMSYRIECPKDVINRSSADVITLYVPAPLGEEVPDLKGSMKITIRG